MGENEGTARVISAVSTDWARGEWNKWKQRKFQLNTNVFCCEGGQTLALVALGGCGASICGDHQNLTGQCPGHEAVAVGRDDLLSSLSCSVILSTASQEEIRRH